MQIDPSTISQQSMYKLMVGAIVPRPIGWISTVGASGVYNLAPYSFFNAVASNPPTVMFCVSSRRDGRVKDTLRNVQESGEFVVNIVSHALAEAMNLTSAELPAQTSEFEFAGLTAIPSVKVKAPRVAESLVHLECVLSQTIDVNSGEVGGATMVLGRIVYVHVDDSVLVGTDKIDPLGLHPVGRMAGASYSDINNIFDIPRPVVD